MEVEVSRVVFLSTTEVGWGWGAVITTAEEESSTSCLAFSDSTLWRVGDLDASLQSRCSSRSLLEERDGDGAHVFCGVR